MFSVIVARMQFHLYHFLGDQSVDLETGSCVLCPGELLVSVSLG